MLNENTNKFLLPQETSQFINKHINGVNFSSKDKTTAVKFSNKSSSVTKYKHSRNDLSVPEKSYLKIVDKNNANGNNLKKYSNY